MTNVTSLLYSQVQGPRRSNLGSISHDQPCAGEAMAARGTELCGHTHSESKEVKDWFSFYKQGPDQGCKLLGLRY